MTDLSSNIILVIAVTSSTQKGTLYELSTDLNCFTLCSSCRNRRSLGNATKFVLFWTGLELSCIEKVAFQGLL